LKGSNTSRKRNKRQILKAYLKSIVTNEKSAKIFPFSILVIEILDDIDVI